LIAIRFARLVTFVFAFAAPLSASAATYYVATTGSDAAAGTMAAPFASWARAQTAAAAGDTVYFRGGTYAYTAATSTCASMTATVNAVVLSKSGTSGNPIQYFAYPGEHPLFDFSGINDTSKYNCRQVGVRIEGDWLYLKGLELKGTLQLNTMNHESWCVYVDGGSDNVFELLDAHHNMGPGFFIQEGGNNTFLNCDSHENEDTLTSNGDGQSADGFGCHPTRTSDTGNIFHGCRAWWNSDDSWDFINSSAVCTVEYSWAWYAGYKPDAVSGGQPVALAAGNGNGFKGGGYGDDPQTGVPAVPPQHVVQQNCAFYNKANGLYANHEIVSPFFYNNTSFNNGTDVDMLGLDGTTVTSVGMLRNNLAYSNNGHGLLADMTNGGPISDEFNSWDTSLNVTVSNADFQSVAFSPPASCPAAYAPGGTACCAPTDLTCFAGMASARQADGSLPVLPFLRLAAGSDLIAKGTNVGLPFSGTAPDLGCFDTALPFGTDGGTSGSSSSSSSGGSSGSSGSSSGSSSGGTGDASTTSSSGSGDASTTTGSSSGGASISTGSSGSGSSGTGSGAGASSSGSGAGSSGAGASSGAHGGADGGDEAAPGSASGCGCRVVSDGATGGGGLSLVAVGLLGFLGRRRASKRELARSPASRP
jgi:MYXO-CTERM domain-containing protein